MADIRSGRLGPGTCATAPLRARLGNAQATGTRTTIRMALWPNKYPPDDLVGVDYHRPTSHGGEREITVGGWEAACHHSP